MQGRTRTGTTESVGDFIHKEKEAKRKASGQLTDASWTTEQLAVGYSTATGNNSQEAIQQGSDEQLDIAQEDIARNKSILRNREIDEYLDTLFVQGVLNEPFMEWYAKCLHTIGMERFNRCVIQARKGRQPQKLLSYKLKGAMQLHNKRLFYLEQKAQQ